MGSRCFIINEWLFHDLAGEHGDGPQERAFRFLECLLALCDHMAVPRGSPWEEKLYDFMDFSEGANELRTISRFLYEVITGNPAKCRWLQETEIERLPDEKAERIHHKDVYLVEAYVSCNASRLVTGDPDLCDAARHNGMDAVMKEEFLDEYLQECAEGQRRGEAGRGM